MNIYTILESKPHNKHYLLRYYTFMNSCLLKNAEITLNFFEKHHILPKSLFPEYASLAKFKWNLIALTPRQHFIAHWMLWKAYGGRSMTYAFKIMQYSTKNYNRTNRISSLVYEKLRRDIAEGETSDELRQIRSVKKS
jgi:hypothetical protein